MREAYKIKPSYVTAIVVEKHFDLFSNSTMFILSDGTLIPEFIFRKLYTKVDGTKVGDSDFNDTYKVVPLNSLDTEKE